MAVGNFPKCLGIILHHEGGFVNHFKLDMDNKYIHIKSWLTRQNLLSLSGSHLCGKAHRFTKRCLVIILDNIHAVLKDALMTLLRLAFAMLITLGSARELIYQLLFATAAGQTNVKYAASQLMEKVDGLCAKGTTTKDAEKLCERFASRLLVGVAQGADKFTRITFTTFITPDIKKKILQLVMQLKVQTQKKLQMKLQSAYCFAPIAIG